MAGGDDSDFFTHVAALSGASAATLYEHSGEPGTGPWLAFAVLKSGQPKTLSFGQAWSNYLGYPRGGDNGGLFIVAAGPPDDPAAYLQLLVEAVESLNTAEKGWSYRYLFIGDPTSGDPAACPGIIQFYTTSATAPGQVNQDATVAMRNAGILVPANAQLQPDPAAPGFRLASFGSAVIKLVANKYQPSNLACLTSDVALPFTGARAGALAFTITLGYSAIPKNDDFTRLDVGIKYFARNAQGRILSQRFPLFGAPIDGKPIPMQVYLDPLHPLDPGRTAFVFAGTGGTCAPMESALRDGFIHPVRLVPKAGVSALVFQSDRVTFQVGDLEQVDCYYLVPWGPFALAAGNSTPAATRLMCGLSPLETIQFDPPGSQINFVPGQHAFAPSLSDGGGATAGSRLDSTYLTAWATVGAAADAPAGSAPLYFSQPQGAAMFAPGADPTTYFEHCEMPACALSDSTAAAAFPFVPYGTLALDAHPDGFAPGDVERLETNVVSLERRARITAHGSAPTAAAFATAAPSRVTTPQGFLVDLAEEASSWKRLHLAQTLWSPAPATSPPTATTLAFGNVDDVLRAAFQTNQQFLVATQPTLPWTSGATPGTGTTFEDELLPQGWPFRIAVGEGSNPGDYRNVLIFKFCDGALADRIADPAHWTAADSFNDDPESVAAWVADYIAQARLLAKGPDKAYFQRFVDAVTTPSWRGILALRTNVDANALPQELRGLVAGIDLSLFDAHHVGVDISFVQATGGKLAPDGNSSVFATVYYVDPAYASGLAAGAPPELAIPMAGAGDYAFRVLTLKTLFANAAITAFSSKLQITLNNLFGDTVAALSVDGVQAPSNSLILDGTYENHDGVGRYVFRTNRDARFLLASNVWRSVELTGASFATLRAPASGLVVSRFSFDGFLDFAMLSTGDGTGQAPYDLLSFGGAGPAVDATGTGLPFSNLHVDMSFDTASPGTPSFSFLIDQLTFAPSVGQAREGSLYGRLPLTLTGMATGTSGLADLGYLPVDLPSLPVDPLGASWTGLVYTLDLGTAGALAAKAGFTARLIVAWGAQSQGNGTRVAVGLALPGASPQARALSLQSVLKLTVGRILLYRDPASETFILRLNNVLLSLLGVALPPGTSTAFILFGNPEPGQRDSVAWYASLNRAGDKAQKLIGGRTGR